jgi:hypothetical protein
MPQREHYFFEPRCGCTGTTILEHLSNDNRTSSYEKQVPSVPERKFCRAREDLSE